MPAAAVPRLSETRLIDRGQVAKDSQFLFTIGGKGQLAIEGGSRPAVSAASCYVAAPSLALSPAGADDRSHAYFVQLGCQSKPLMCAGITPAPLRDRRPVFLGTYPNPRLAPALLAQFLGPDAIDEEAKAEAGASLVFAINGFQCAALHPAPPQTSRCCA